MSASPSTLRPLGLGEVLDRAVTLCVKHFVPLAAIFVVYAVPLSVVQFYASNDFAHLVQVLVSAAGPHGGTVPDARGIGRALSSLPPPNGWYPLFAFLTVVVSPLASAALILACARFYRGESVDFATAYRRALGRWLPLIGVNLLYLGVGIVAYVLVVLLGVALVFAIVAVTAALHALGVALAVVVALAAGLAGIAFLIVAGLAFQISYFTCVIEDAGPIRAFAAGVRRVFAGVGLVRSLLVGLAYLAILVGVALVSLAGEVVLAGLAHSALAGQVYATIVRVATAAFTTAFIAIFYYDLRVREEGLDLELAAERVGALAAPTP